MKIKFIDDITFNIYIRNKELGNIDFSNKEVLEKYLKNIFSKIKSRYNINIEGFYDVIIYIDKKFGAIFNLNKEKLDYYDYFNGQIDLNINAKEVEFLYKIDNASYNLFNKLEMKQINNDIYYKIKKELSTKEYMYLIEHIEKIYI